MYYLTRTVFKFNGLAAIFTTLTFVLCSWWPAEARSGSYTKFYYLFLPLLFAFFIQSKDKRFLVYAALLLSLFVLQSGLVQFSVIFFLMVFTLSEFANMEIPFRERAASFFIYFKNLVIICVMVAFICAAKIVPTLEVLYSDYNLPHKNITKSYSAYLEREEPLLIKDLWDTIITPIKPVEEAYHDYGHGQMYMGIIPVFLFFLSIVLYPRRTFRFLFLFIFFLVLAMGSQAVFNIHKFFWMLLGPLKQIFKLEKYFVVYLLFFATIIAGHAFNVLSKERCRGRYIISLGILLLFLSITDLYQSNRWLYKDIFDTPLPSLRKESDFFHVKLSGVPIRFVYAEDIVNYYALDQYYNVLQGRGTVNGVVNINRPSNVIAKYFYETDGNEWRERSANPNEMYTRIESNPDYRGEVFPMDDGNHIRPLELSPHKIKFNAFLKKAGIVVINQNYDQGWRSILGKIGNCNGLLCVYIEKEGIHTILLHYVPLIFYVSSVLSVCSLLGIVYVLMFVLKPGA